MKTGYAITMDGLAQTRTTPEVHQRGEQLAIPCVLMRGGTSRGAFLLRRHLPADPAAVDRVILSIYGSPDQRQIDGLGGAHPLTSKVAIIGPPTRPDADVDYTFGQVRIGEPVVDYDGNCGNMSAAVGPFAIEQGPIETTEPMTTVRIHRWIRGNSNPGLLGSPCEGIDVRPTSRRGG